MKSDTVASAARDYRSLIGQVQQLVEGHELHLARVEEAKRTKSYLQQERTGAEVSLARHRRRAREIWVEAGRRLGNPARNMTLPPPSHAATADDDPGALLEEASRLVRAPYREPYTLKAVGAGVGVSLVVLGFAWVFHVFAGVGAAAFVTWLASVIGAALRWLGAPLLAGLAGGTVADRITRRSLQDGTDSVFATMAAAAGTAGLVLAVAFGLLL
ncbi:hypothetical protein [Rhizohabitans arisaemae]|uniref:hypothetical protein n=1 Tax=Rhizohabitans arisaemae TaxID=2720610 RepID=UPI0024B1CCC8|nr:hypothetical protein [Rhizohabitans arisaemae]